jgi:catechol 2,3-dioxygenase-like lactoylglutathione lyase family enzyme
MTGHTPKKETTLIQRMDNVGIVVDDLAGAIAFFVELGLELEGEATVEGPLVDRVIGTPRCPKRHRDAANPGRPQPGRAIEVPHTSGRRR